ncbi:MAG: hypothetical protein C9356_12380 [Oleiphilus sp.]|nr:MAG: hypothetical protein C9356_12380 [Oleiphilus sp.]
MSSQKQREDAAYTRLLARAELNEDIRIYAAWTGEKIEQVAVKLGYTAWSLIATKTVICDFHKDTTVFRRRAAISH